MIPTMRAGVRPNGASGKPVTPVRIVVTRKVAVQAGSGLPASRPYSTIKPDAIPIRLRMTWICRNVSVGIPQVISAPYGCRVHLGRRAARSKVPALQSRSVDDRPYMADGNRPLPETRDG